MILLSTIQIIQIALVSVGILMSTVLPTGFVFLSGKGSNRFNLKGKAHAASPVKTDSRAEVANYERQLDQARSMSRLRVNKSAFETLKKTAHLTMAEARTSTQRLLARLDEQLSPVDPAIKDGLEQA